MNSSVPYLYNVFSLTTNVEIMKNIYVSLRT